MRGRTAVDAAVKSPLSKRNFYLMILEGTLFWMAMAFIEPTTVVSVFIHDYTHSIQLAGLSATLRQVATIVGMFIAGMQLHRIDDYGKVLHRFGFIIRSPLLFVLPLLIIGVDGYPMAIAFIVFQTLFFAADGLAGLCWQAINAHTIAPRDRGLISGYQQVTSALVGLASATVIKLLMDSQLALNTRYAFIFGCCALSLVVNSFVLRQLKDDPSVNAAPPPRSFSRYISSLVDIWKHTPTFRHIMYGRFLFNGGLMAAALAVLFGARVIGLAPHQTSTLIYVQIAGQLAGGLFWGYFNRHMGNNRTMIGSNIAPIAVGVLGILLFLLGAGKALFWPVAVLVFLGSAQVMGYIGFSNSILEKMPQEAMPIYVILQFLTLFPFSFLPYIAGVIAQGFSFLPVYILVAVFGVAGLFYCIRYTHTTTDAIR